MKYQIDGVSISLDSFAPELPNSWFVYTPTGVIVQTGVIDTLEKAEAFLRAIQRMHLERKSSLRLMDILLCRQKDEWGLITAQDILMAWFQSQKEFPGQCALLNLPTEHFYQPKNQAPESEFFLKDAAKLTDLLNVKGWGAYCKWINKEITFILQNIPLESMDSYTLEAYLKNFNHEIDSQLLRNLEKEVQEILLKMGGLYQIFQYPCVPPETMINLEKKLIKARSEIRRLLKFQYETLLEIERIIPIIEDSHPGYAPLNRKCLILSSLIKNHLEVPEAESPSWSQELMLLQLLNEELGVLTVINCDKGLDRTNLAFAVMLTLSILKQSNQIEKLIDFALHWNQAAREVNDLANKFRQLFLEVLEKICIPLTKQAGDVQQVPWSETQKVNTELSLLLPSKLLQLDGKGNTTGLTKAGHALMIQLVNP